MEEAITELNDRSKLCHNAVNKLGALRHSEGGEAAFKMHVESRLICASSSLPAFLQRVRRRHDLAFGVLSVVEYQNIVGIPTRWLLVSVSQLSSHSLISHERTLRLLLSFIWSCFE